MGRKYQDIQAIELNEIEQTETDCICIAAAYGSSSTFLNNLKVHDRIYKRCNFSLILNACS